jgi:hypothetical protein
MLLMALGRGALPLRWERTVRQTGGLRGGE